jgi:excisionase family DNA binding protein
MGGLRDKGERRKGERRTGEVLLSAEEMAEYFGVKTTTVYRWCREGRIPCLKIGKHWRARRKDLADFLQEAKESEGARRPR